MGSNDIHSLTHTKRICKYHIAFAREDGKG